jgi:hypothetical protein
MAHATTLRSIAGTLDELAPALESLNLCANFLRRKLDNPDAYSHRTVEELTQQLLDAEGRVNNIRARL